MLERRFESLLLDHCSAPSSTIVHHRTCDTHLVRRVVFRRSNNPPLHSTRHKIRLTVLRFWKLYSVLRALPCSTPAWRTTSNLHCLDFLICKEASSGETRRKTKLEAEIMDLAHSNHRPTAPAHSSLPYQALSGPAGGSRHQHLAMSLCLPFSRPAPTPLACCAFDLGHGRRLGYSARVAFNPTQPGLASQR